MENCKKCNGLKWIIDKEKGKAIPCSCQRTQKEYPFDLPPKFQKSSFENFQTYKQTQLFQAKRISEEFAKKFPIVEYGLLFVGPNGVGKTHLVCAIYNKILKEKNIRGIFIDFSNLNFKLKETFSFEEATGDLIDFLANSPLLIIDDLGSIKATTWFQDILYEIINQRYLKNKPLLATTAYQIEDTQKETLYERLGDGITSRLLELCKVIEIQAKDHRKEVFQAGYKAK